MTLEAAFDELIATNELKAWCDSYLAAQMLEAVVVALSENEKLSHQSLSTNHSCSLGLK
jgi:hypothetical protein